MRGHGEGSVFRRSRDGRWCAQVSLPDGRRRTATAKTRQEAQRELARLKRVLEDGDLMLGDDPTLESWLGRWIEMARHSVSPATLTRYEEHARLRWIPALGKTRLSKLRADQLEAVYAAALQNGSATYTVRGCHATIRRALGEAERLGLVGRNVASVARAPRGWRKESTAFSADEARRFLVAVRRHPLEAFFVVAVATGLRRGELLGLRWQDVDLEAGVLRVRQTLSTKHDGNWEMREPKTKSSKRPVVLMPLAIDALRRHRATQSERRLALGRAWRDDLDLVFCRDDGSPEVGNHVLQRQFYPLLERFGLPRIRLHDLRHTTASLLLELGVHPKVVQEMLGHTTISMTMDMYSHVAPTIQADAVARLAGLLSG